MESHYACTFVKFLQVLIKSLYRFFSTLPGILLIAIILSNACNISGEAKVYNSAKSFKDMLSDLDWTWNGTKWSVTTEGYLTSGSIGCGDSANFSTKIDGPCTVTFDWEKIGDAELRCHYDNILDPQKSPICENWNFAPGRINVPNGHHTITWCFNSKSCGSGDSVAYFKSINTSPSGQNNIQPIPPNTPPSCSLTNATNVPNPPFPPSPPPRTEIIDNNTINNKYKLQEIVDDPAVTVIIMKDGIYHGPINITNGPKAIKSEHFRRAQIDCQHGIVGIAVESANAITLENLTLYNISGFGIQVANSSNCNVIGNDIYSSMHGISIFFSSYITIKFNHVNCGKLPGYDGLYLNGSYLVKAKQNIFNVADCSIIAYLVDSYCNEILDIHDGDVFDNGIVYKIINGKYPVSSVESRNCWRLPCLQCQD